MDTLTLSVQQKNLAEKRIAALGLDDKIRVHLMDYRQLPADFEGQFDAFVSVEMVEVRMPTPYGDQKVETSHPGRVGGRYQIPPAVLQDPRLGAEARARCGRDQRDDATRVSILRVSVHRLCTPLPVAKLVLSLRDVICDDGTRRYGRPFCAGDGRGLWHS